MEISLHNTRVLSPCLICAYFFVPRVSWGKSWCWELRSSNRYKAQKIRNTSAQLPHEKCFHCEEWHLANYSDFTNVLGLTRSIGRTFSLLKDYISHLLYPLPLFEPTRSSSCTWKYLMHASFLIWPFRMQDAIININRLYWLVK